MNAVKSVGRSTLLLTSLALLLLCARGVSAQTSDTTRADSSEFDDFNFDQVPVEDDGVRTTRLITLGGQMRLRSEIDRRHQVFLYREDAFDYHLLRTRVNLTISPFEGVTGMIQAQDSRTFGSSRNSLGTDVNAFDVHQAWFQIEDFIGEGVSLKVGRQELAYGNERLIGAVGWHNRGRTFDALKIRSENSWGSVDLFGSRIDEGSFPMAPIGTQHLFGLWTTISSLSDQTLDLFVLYDNDNIKFVTDSDSAVDRLNRGTYGVRWLAMFSSLTVEAEGAWQNGDEVVGVTSGSDTGTLGSISAYMASLRANLRAGQFDFGLLYTRLSGDGSPDSTVEAFNTLYATNHKFYGYMDYFPSRSSSVGLQDIGLSLGWRPGDATSIGIDGHYFLPAIEGDPFGTEVDLTVKHNYNRAVAFTAGLSMLLPDDSFSSRFSDENGYWGYLMTTVSL